MIRTMTMTVEIPSLLASQSLTQNVYNLGHVAGQTIHKLASDHNASGRSASSPLTLIISLIESFLVAVEHGGWRGIFRLLGSMFTSYKTWWLNLVQKDPVHVLIETLLISFLAYLLLYQKKKDYRRKMQDRLSDDEIRDLLTDWKENGRVPLSADRDTMMNGAGDVADIEKKTKRSPMGDVIIERMSGSKVDISMGDGKNSSSRPRSPSSKRTVLNFATHDFLGSACPAKKDASTDVDVIKEAAIEALSKYGCGSCGPRGFYGTIDAHLDLEDEMAKFTNTDGAILYSDGASCSSSTVASFAKRGDLLIVDEGVYEALGTGVTLSRANVKYFKHNDMNDLRRVLERVQATDESLGRKLNDQRRFIVVEALYKNYGTVCPLDELVKLKEEFCYRLILDESMSFGTIGKTGRGALEHFGLKPMQHAEIICIGLENAMGSIGGITVGNEEVVDHQRLSGAGYCFSASLPPFLATASKANLKRLETQPEVLGNLKENIAFFYKTLNSISAKGTTLIPNKLVVTSDEGLSPMVYLQLADQALTREEQIELLDLIALKCLEDGVFIVSTGNHVNHHLHKIPPPMLRLTIMAKQNKTEICTAITVLKDAVVSAMKGR